jgi:hypothetical protein
MIVSEEMLHFDHLLRCLKQQLDEFVVDFDKYVKEEDFQFVEKLIVVV